MNLRPHTSCIVSEFFPPLRGWRQLRDENQQKRWPRNEGLLSLKSFSLTKRTSLGASSPGGSGGGRGKGRRACNYVPGIWISPLWNFNSTSNPSVAPRRLSFQISANQCEAETSANVNKHWKTRGKGNGVLTNVIPANRHFASTFSMQIFKFQRRSCKVSFLFSPFRQSAPESLLAGYKRPLCSCTYITAFIFFLG